MNNPINLLLNQLLAKRPDVANNPRFQEMLDVVRNNDSKRGIELANNLCETYGDTKESAIKKAKEYFGFK